MLIIIVEIFFLVYFVNKQKKYHFISALFVIFALQLIILIIYRLELNFIWNRSVYWSDAEYYWLNTLDMLYYHKLDGYNILYTFYSYLIQITSPIISPFWINLSNILLIDLSFLLGIECNLQKSKTLTSIKKIPLIIYFVSIANPLVIYSLLRNLKDGLFLFLLVLSVYLYKRIILIIHNPFLKTISILFYLLFFATIFPLIRPWGFVIPFINIFTSYLSGDIIIKNGKLQKIFFLTLIIFLIFLGIFNYRSTVSFWINSIGTESQGLIGLVSGMFRMILGPGPLRTLNPQKFFWYYTNIGNITIFVGSIFWYLGLPLFISEMFMNIKQFKFYHNYFFMNLVIFLFIYSLFYGGSAEVRFRGVIYILISIIWHDMSQIDIPTDKILLLYFFVSIIIWFPAFFMAF